VIYAEDVILLGKKHKYDEQKHGIFVIRYEVGLSV
jgi:hypothetical protein